MKVHLRKRLQKKGKRISLYLEYYKGSRKSDQGKVLPIREYEHLGILLHNKPSTPLQKQENKEKIEELLESLEPKERLELVIKILPFILPKVDKIGHTYNEPFDASFF